MLFGLSWSPVCAAQLKEHRRAVGKAADTSKKPSGKGLSSNSTNLKANWNLASWVIVTPCPATWSKLSPFNNHQVLWTTTTTKSFADEVEQDLPAFILLEKKKRKISFFGFSLPASLLCSELQTVAFHFFNWQTPSPKHFQAQSFSFLRFTQWFLLRFAFFHAYAENIRAPTISSLVLWEVLIM